LSSILIILIKRAKRQRLLYFHRIYGIIREGDLKMAEVTIRIPEELRDIISDTGEDIYIEAIIEVAKRKLADLERQLKSLSRKISKYESIYKKSYEEFSQSVPDTIKGHEDWIEWSYLVKLKDELSTKIEKIKLLLGNA